LSLHRLKYPSENENLNKTLAESIQSELQSTERYFRSRKCDWNNGKICFEEFLHYHHQGNENFEKYNVIYS
jgi:hypothetical protein